MVSLLLCWSVPCRVCRDEITASPECASARRDALARCRIYAAVSVAGGRVPWEPAALAGAWLPPDCAAIRAPAQATAAVPAPIAASRTGRRRLAAGTRLLEPARRRATSAA